MFDFGLTKHYRSEIKVSIINCINYILLNADHSPEEKSRKEHCRA